MSLFLTFIRRLRPADLILPAGAALISAGLQQLVDREDRQRRRLAALQGLVDVHRGALAAAGVTLPDELVDDEQHPLDVDGALQFALARMPSDPEDNRITGNPNPVNRRRRRLLAAAAVVAGATAAVVIPRTGFLQALSLTGLVPTGGWPPAVLEEEPPAPDESFGPISTNSYPDDREHREHVSCFGADGQCETRPVPEGVIGHGEPPAEECGWPNCDWTSDATRSALSQQTAAAVHRNRCVYRPAGAQVPGA